MWWKFRNLSYLCRQSYKISTNSVTNRAENVAIMKRYLRNLMMAACGRNPFQEELEQEKKAVEATRQRIEETYRLYRDLEQRINGYQNLIENQRRRLVEKDALIAQMMRDGAKTAQAYEERIGELQKALDDRTRKKEQ